MPPPRKYVCDLEMSRLVEVRPNLLAFLHPRFVASAMTQSSMRTFVVPVASLAE